MVEVSLAGGRGVALVDEEDAARVLLIPWHLHKGSTNTYVRNRGVGYLHRFVMGLPSGDRREADHIDGNTLDNRRSNLRVLTRAQNQQNRHRQAGRASRYRGVTWDANKELWIARVKVDGITHNIGSSLNEGIAGRLAANARAVLMPYSTT